MRDLTSISTLGELKRAGYKPKSIKAELRMNLIAGLRRKEPVFSGIWDTKKQLFPIWSVPS